jgi:O-antigen/teichoic acid export membrane protein
MFSLSVYQFGTQLIARLRFMLDPFIIGVCINAETAGIYALTVRAHDTVRMIASQIMGSIIPSMAHLHGEGNRELFRTVISMAYRTQAFIAGVGFAGVIAFNQDFMKLWLPNGADVYAGAVVNIAAAAWTIAWIISAVSYDAYFCMGEFPRLLRFTSLDSIIRFPLMIALLLSGGLWGVPIASLIAQLFAVNWLLTRSVWNTLDFDRAARRRIIRQVAALLAVPMALALLVMATGVALDTWLTFAAGVVVFAAIASVGNFLVDRDLLGFVRRGGKVREPATPNPATSRKP